MRLRLLDTYTRVLVYVVQVSYTLLDPGVPAAEERIRILATRTRITCKDPGVPAILSP